MHFLLLTPEQVELAARRFRDHGNSPASIARHYRDGADGPRLQACLAIRRMERQFAMNLGTVCFKFLEKEQSATPRIQQRVMDYVARWSHLEGGDRWLVVSVERVREIDRLAQGDGAAWPTSPDS